MGRTLGLQIQKAQSFDQGFAMVAVIVPLCF